MFAVNLVKQKYLHVQSMSEGPFFRRLGHFLFGFLCYFTHKAHLVQWKLILPCRTLHDGRQEGLGIKKSRQPDRIRKVEVRSPAFQLFNPCQEVNIPAREAVHGGIRKLGPGWRNLVLKIAALCV